MTTAVGSWAPQRKTFRQVGDNNPSKFQIQSNSDLGLVRMMPLGLDEPVEWKPTTTAMMKLKEPSTGWINGKSRARQTKETRQLMKTKISC